MQLSKSNIPEPGDKAKTIPTLYEWAGGMAALEKLTDVFYKKVLQDNLLEPVFRDMPASHVKRVAYFIAEVFGGPKAYTNEGGSHFKMIQKHLSKHFTETQRKRWVELMLESADETGLPDDPEFRSAFAGYLEWGTRIAVINSNASELKENPDMPMPKWGWGETGGPYIK
jgi:hemoglobin